MSVAENSGKLPAATRSMTQVREAENPAIIDAILRVLRDDTAHRPAESRSILAGQVIYPLKTLRMAVPGV